jgi:hypothetical protein
VEVRSPEIWVTWDGDVLRVIGRDEAEDLVAAGESVEFEAVLAGKLSFTYTRGRCPKCHLVVTSEGGVLRDARPMTPSARQDDLATFSQGMLLRDSGGLKREHT